MYRKNKVSAYKEGMMSGKVVIPLPNVWEEMKKKYKLPKETPYSIYRYEITLPHGWFILIDLDIKGKYDVFNDDSKKIGQVYMDDRVGFTYINKDFI